MLGTHSREPQQDQAVRPDDGAPQAPQPPFRFEVLISSNGTAALNGERMALAEGEELHVAVLDAMHRAAQDRGQPVDATILDLRENGSATQIRVAPDGSSQLLVDGGRGNSPAPEETVPAPQQVESAPEQSMPRVEQVAPAPEQPMPAPEHVVPPAEQVEPAGAVPQDTGSAPEELASAPVPGELADAVVHINRAAAAGEPQRAMVLALRLREHAVRSYGEEHPYTLEARDLEAYVARLGGNYASATAIYLELARVCHRQGNPRAYGYLKRSAGNWQMLTDPQLLLAHGRGLLATWAALASEPGPAANDTTLPRHVRERLHALAGTTETGGAGKTS